MPLNSSLIRGAKFVWGKTNCNLEKQRLQVFSEQKIRTKSVVSQGGGTIQDFDMFALTMIAIDTFFCLSILETNTILH
jgi:hypothetical protein